MKLSALILIIGSIIWLFGLWITIATTEDIIIWFGVVIIWLAVGMNTTDREV